VAQTLTTRRCAARSQHRIGRRPASRQWVRQARIYRYGASSSRSSRSAVPGGRRSQAEAASATSITRTIHDSKAKRCKFGEEDGLSQKSFTDQRGRIDARLRHMGKHRRHAAIGNEGRLDSGIAWHGLLIHKPWGASLYAAPERKPSALTSRGDAPRRSRASLNRFLHPRLQPAS
jgi:hypothetical protein